MTMSTLRYRLIRKLQQESTWRGLIAIAAACGCAIDPARADAIVAAALTLIGFINVWKD